MIQKSGKTIVLHKQLKGQTLTFFWTGGGDVDRPSWSLPHRVCGGHIHQVHLPRLQLPEGPLGALWPHLSQGQLLVLALRTYRGQGQVVA